MHPSHHPIIESVTKPFADNAELKLSASRILEENFDPAHPGIPAALKRLESRDEKKVGWIRKSAIWILAAAVLGFTIYPEVTIIQRYLGLSDLLYSFNEPKSPAFPSHLTEQEKLLLGDPNLDLLTQKKQKKMLFESDPDNPAYFAEFAEAHRSLHDKLPDDFLETALRIDPDNAFFLYWAASEYQEKAIDKRSSSAKKPGASRPVPRFVDGVRLKPLPVAQEYTILDQTAYDEAMSLIERASQLAKFDNYSISLMKERMRLLPRPQNLIEYVRKIAYQFSSSSNGIMSLIRVADLLNARAEELSKKGDKEAFVILAKRRDAFVASMMNSRDGFLVDALVQHVVVSSTATNFHAAADRLGLTELEEKYRKQNEACIAESDRRELARSKSSPALELIEEKSGMLHRMALPLVDKQVKNPPALADADLKPMRMVEHEVMGRLGVITVSLSLLLGALIIFHFRFLAARTIRLTAKRFACLLTFCDWLWIVSLGVVLPILAFFYISRLSPFSGREHGATFFLFLFPSLHLTVLLMNLLFIPAVITRWRLKRRAAAFRLGSWMDWLALPVIAVMLIYSVAAYPGLAKFKLNPFMQVVIAAPVVGWLGFVFLHALRMFLGSARSRIIQTATAIAVLPAYAVAAMALCTLMPFYHAGEKHWVPQDKLLLIDPDAPDLGAYEFKIAAQKRREIKEMLGLPGDL